MHRELFKSGSAHLCHRHSSTRGGLIKMMKMKMKIKMMKMKIKMKIKIMVMMMMIMQIKMMMVMIILRGRRFKDDGKRKVFNL